MGRYLHRSGTLLIRLHLRAVEVTPDADALGPLGILRNSSSCFIRVHFEAFLARCKCQERLCEASTVAYSLTTDLGMHRHFRCEAVASSPSGNGSSPSSPSSKSMASVQLALGSEVRCLTFITLPSCTCYEKNCSSLWYLLEMSVRPFCLNIIALMPAGNMRMASAGNLCAICRLRQLWCKCKR